jgi:3-deoxy-D-manno-octulosonate 8-phosphate phosphatase (KDO 8-P phosphatase)
VAHRDVLTAYQETLPVLDLQKAAAGIKLLLFDVDGVLTDGKILLHADGTESKQFDIKDGTAIVWAQRAGLLVGFLSARTSASTAQRAAQLGVAIVHQGVANKLDAYEKILADHGLTSGEVAYMGDDVLDLPVLSRVALAAAPVDAVEEVRARVAWVATARGGDGAARELIERVLRAQGRWDDLMASYTADAQGHPS